MSVYASLKIEITSAAKDVGSAALFVGPGGTGIADPWLAEISSKNTSNAWTGGIIKAPFASTLTKSTNSPHSPVAPVKSKDKVSHPLPVWGWLVANWIAVCDVVPALISPLKFVAVVE